MAALAEKQSQAIRDIEKLNGQIETMGKFIENASAAFDRLNTQVQSLDKSENDYKKKIEDLKDESQSTKDLLNTPLPVELQRLLTDATKGATN